ncbi:MAG: DUF3301 domain-containing protein [Magnetococcales bacterium]|nr:DUF3301 domain-containing protein [Magnetococcales bacterium]
MELYLLTGLGLILAWWHWHMKARELAWNVVSRICREMEVVLLDETVVLISLRPVRSGRRWHLRRVYAFEFMGDGMLRQTGLVIFVGERMESLLTDSANSVH